MVLILLVFTGIGPELVHTGRIRAQIIIMIFILIIIMIMIIIMIIIMILE